MYFGHFINEEFSAYLNRYCTGIVLLKDDIEKITVYYELSDSFATYACRIRIHVELEYETLSLEKRKLVDKYFYDWPEETGTAFVSFIYNRHNSDFNVEIVQSFISHYLYAKNLFEGFIRAIVTQKCVVEVVPLEEEPFFNYIESFIRKAGYATKKEVRFNRQYKEITNRDFEYDCFYHKILLKAEYLGEDPIEDGVTDEELFKAGGGEIKELRRFVVDERIPFVISSYGDVIDQIRIDVKVLREKAKTYVPKNTYSDICPKSILQFLERRTKAEEEKKALFDKKCQETGIQIGDYIYAETSYDIHEDQRIGVVKEMHLDYSDKIEFSYNILNMNLTESKRALKRVNAVDIQYILPEKIVAEQLQAGKLKTKYQFTALFKNKGIVNPLFKVKKKKL